MFGFEQSRNKLREIGRTFHYGFLFDSVSDVLEKVNKGDKLTKQDKTILKKAKRFLNNIKSGKEDVNLCNASSNCPIFIEKSFVPLLKKNLIFSSILGCNLPSIFFI